ncbi:L,D-transpeptidase [Pseudonocardia bannensis]|uniref:L,D-transpeptidase n=1 Tax=Pseudonocardia bannensis TaxID=630973 RepID=A0A848DSN7_9PSEU|nr:L,D-transpeptidase [Pseudonocardia bannensis]NMH95499.1 L,D-transpeptidase [Pseudonocardia bannensis]
MAGTTRHDARRRRRSTGAARAGAIACAAVLAAVGITGSALAAEGGGDDLVEGTPCTVTARACVDKDARTAWLIHGGRVTHGPVDIGLGADGQETPKGTFTVQWKNKDHRSAEFGGEPMPYSVFFAPGGIAFHEGDPDHPSAGCVHLRYDDAVTFFEDLQVGDEVQVH